MRPKWGPSTIDGVVMQAFMTNSNTDKKFVGISQEEANENQLPPNIEPYQAVPNEPENQIDIYKAMKISDRTKTIGSLSEHINGTLTSHPVDVIVNDKGEKSFHVPENVKKQSISENYPWVNDETVYNIDLSVYFEIKSIKEIDVMQKEAGEKMLKLKAEIESWLRMSSGNYKIRVTISREKNRSLASLWRRTTLETNLAPTAKSVIASLLFRTIKFPSSPSGLLFSFTARQI